MEKRIYVDMDNVLVDFKTGIEKFDGYTIQKFSDRLDEIPGIFSQMEPMPGAIESIHKLANQYDLFILSTAPWLNPSAWADKVKWVQAHFGKDETSIFYKRLIISHHKHLNKGDYLIDDRRNNGAADFEGELIHFGSTQFPDWEAVTNYLL
jgi:Uncharacterized protein conserved in bacteria